MEVCWMQISESPIKSHIAILHYAAPPSVGGVESTIGHHARILSVENYSVQVIAGQGGALPSSVSGCWIPALYSRHPEVLTVKSELDQGVVSARFYHLVDSIVASLSAPLAAADVLMVHNVLTLHKNLPLTAALHRLLLDGASTGIRVLAWHHDLAWRSPQYRTELHAGFPWDLLRQPWPGVTNVTVSESRRHELAELYRVSPAGIKVVPPGIDVEELQAWTPLTRHMVDVFRLQDADLLLLLPARITRRKNIELALSILAELRRSTSLDARLLVTGPPGPHNPANNTYLQSLLALRSRLCLVGAVHFVYALGDEQTPVVPDNATMASLYALSDALLFPSQEEGFGIPMLEAGLARLPIFCSDIPALRETGGTGVHYFPADADPTSVAKLIEQHLLTDRALCLRRRTRDTYRWEQIVQERIIPLIEGCT